jgi:hypothetical protein
LLSLTSHNPQPNEQITATKVTEYNTILFWISPRIEVRITARRNGIRLYIVWIPDKEEIRLEIPALNHTCSDAR